MKPSIALLFAQRLGEYAHQHELEKVEILFHGGEPLLCPSSFYSDLVKAIRRELPTVCTPSFAIQSNGSLLTREWLDHFSRLGISLSISLDGPRVAQDRYRRFATGQSSFDSMLRVFEMIAGHPEGKRVFGGVLAVADLRDDPEEVFAFHRSLNTPGVDYLWPDGNHDAPPPEITDFRADRQYANWLAQVFDLWFTDGIGKPSIRFLENILVLLLGGASSTEGIGPAELALLTIQTDGEIQDSDVFATAYEGAARFGTGASLHTTSFTALQTGGSFRSQAKLYSREGLCRECQACELVDVCGGGFIPHRFATEWKFCGPSVYCGNLKSLISHIRDSAAAEIKRAVRDSDMNSSSEIASALPPINSVVNCMDDVDDFISTWDLETNFGTEMSAAKETSRRQHVNVDGDLSNPTSSVLTLGDPRFWAAVEPDVRSLVELLISRFGAITYSSCQGHRLPDGGLRERSIGLLPRDDSERLWLHSFLRSVCNVAAGCHAGPVTVVVEEDTLSGNGYESRGLDLRFRANKGDVDSYFRDVADAYATFMDLIDYYTRLNHPDTYEPTPPGIVGREWDCWQSNRQAPDGPVRFVVVQDDGSVGSEHAKAVLCNFDVEAFASTSTGVSAQITRCLYPDETSLLSRQIDTSPVVIVQNHAWALIAWLTALRRHRRAKTPRVVVSHFDYHADDMSPLLYRRHDGQFVDAISREAVDFEDIGSVARAISSGAIGPGAFILPMAWCCGKTEVWQYAPSSVGRCHRDWRGRVDAVSESPLAVDGLAMAMIEDASGNLWVRESPLGRYPKLDDDDFWIIDIDCDFFSNEMDGCSDWRERAGWRATSEEQTGARDAIIAWLQAAPRPPNIATVAMSPNFCHLEDGGEAVRTLVPELRRITGQWRFNTAGAGVSGIVRS